MLSGNVAIEGLAYVMAPHRITSAAIEDQLAATLDRLGLPLGQIESFTGIKERRFWDASVQPSDAATIAAQKVLDETHINPDEIGCLINTSVSKDYIEPSVACLVHGNLGLSSHCLNYDISNACLGFLSGIDTMVMMIERGLIKYGMIVDGESSREVVEATIKRLQGPNVTVDTFRENFPTLTLGSGAVAMILGPKNRSKTGHVINGSANLAATEHNRLCLGQRDHMRTDGHALLMAGKELAIKTWALARKTLPNWSTDCLDLYAPHQVGIKHMRVINAALGIDDAKVHLNLFTQGNIGPAALPITLAMAVEAGKAPSGTQVGLLGIGSGLNCTMMSVTW